MAQQFQTRAELEAVLRSKAQAEPVFRQALVSNSRATLEKELGIVVPNGCELRVVEETATINYLVLPAAANGELADADLDGVAGGFLGKLIKKAAGSVKPFEPAPPSPTPIPYPITGGTSKG